MTADKPIWLARGDATVPTRHDATELALVVSEAAATYRAAIEEHRIAKRELIDALAAARRERVPFKVLSEQTGYSRTRLNQLLNEGRNRTQ